MQILLQRCLFEAAKETVASKRQRRLDYRNQANGSIKNVKLPWVKRYGLNGDEDFDEDIDILLPDDKPVMKYMRGLHWGLLENYISITGHRKVTSGCCDTLVLLEGLVMTAKT